MISVVMTTYNGEKYVQKQLESLVHQSMMFDELIIIDDCSVDDTINIIFEFIKSHKELNIRFMQNEKNCGYKSNFLNAINHSNGDYIFLCDQDDIWEHNKIEVMMDYMIHNPNIYALNTNNSYIDGTGKFVSKDMIYCNSNQTNDLVKINTKYIMHSNISPGCTMCFTKCVKTVFLDSYDAYLPHDYCINIIASLMDGLYYLNAKLIRYRIHDSNTIGLSMLKEQSTHLPPNKENRNKYASSIWKICHAIKKVESIKNNDLDFFIKRHDMLSSPKPINLLVIIGYLPKYIQYYSFRVFLGDLRFGVLSI